MSARYLVMLPNFFLVTYAPDTLLVRVLLPLTTDRSFFQVHLYTTTGEIPSEKVIEDWRRLTIDVEEEDIAIHKEQQAGRASPVTSDGGVLSPVWEDTIHAFHEYLVEKLA